MCGQVYKNNLNYFHFFTDANGNHDSDIAILKLSSPLTFNDHVKPACLPPNEDFYPENEGNVRGVVSGWGLLKDRNSSSLLMSTGFWNSNSI